MQSTVNGNIGSFLRSLILRSYLVSDVDVCLMVVENLRHLVGILFNCLMIAWSSGSFVPVSKGVCGMYGMWQAHFVCLYEIHTSYERQRKAQKTRNLALRFHIPQMRPSKLKPLGLRSQLIRFPLHVKPTFYFRNPWPPSAARFPGTVNNRKCLHMRVWSLQPIQRFYIPKWKDGRKVPDDLRSSRVSGTPFLPNGHLQPTHFIWLAGTVPKSILNPWLSQGMLFPFMVLNGLWWNASLTSSPYVGYDRRVFISYRVCWAYIRFRSCSA